jgi:hypothetical protein
MQARFTWGVTFAAKQAPRTSIQVQCLLMKAPEIK